MVYMNVFYAHAVQVHAHHTGGIRINFWVLLLYYGHFDFEIGHYIKELYLLRFLHFAIWAMLALFIQTLFKNPYLGLFVLIIILIGFPLVFSSLLEQDIFKFNKVYVFLSFRQE